MKLRKLGSTGLEVSPIGLGLAALGRPGYINLGHADDLGHDYDVAAMEARAHTVLDRAWELGVRYFDAARSYGRAEEFLASWLTDSHGGTVGSKWGYTYTAGWKTEADAHEVKDHTLPTLTRQHAESSALLGRRLNLYQIHSATLESGVLDRPEVLAELVRMRERGGVHIGLSVSGPEQAATIGKALEARVDGTAVFEGVQATWNLLERSAETALAEAHAAGWGVIVKEGLANGRLTPRGGEPFLERLAELGPIDAVALGAALAQPWASVVLSGAATVKHLESNLRAADLAAALPLDGWDSMREDPALYWKKRASLAWN
ncbi:MAG: aldo/keto reductase [Acidobacteria bacterium]|nr:aldo/keto reductase [Acidobacteriota bacterium]